MKQAATYREKKKELLSFMRERKFPGNRLPTENALTEMLSCSRGMLREILRELEHAGFVTKKQGIGNFIHPSAFARLGWIAESSQFQDIILATGKRPRVEMISRDAPCKAPPVRGRFSRRPEQFAGTDHTVHIFYADDVPAICCEYFIPREIVFRESPEASQHIRLYDYLNEYCGQKIEQKSVEFVIERTDAALAGYLQVPEGKLLLLWEETYYNYCDEVVCMAQNTFNLDVLPMSLLRQHEQ